jgi:hypothetical protein
MGICRRHNEKVTRTLCSLLQQRSWRRQRRERRFVMTRNLVSCSEVSYGMWPIGICDNWRSYRRNIRYFVQKIALSYDFTQRAIPQRHTHRQSRPLLCVSFYCPGLIITLQEDQQHENETAVRLPQMLIPQKLVQNTRCLHDQLFVVLRTGSIHFLPASRT